MRLHTNEIDAIRTCFHSVFADGRIYLFGSRADDRGKGGDIDLFLEVPDKTDLFRKKIQFLSQLKRAIGDRRIDIVFDEDGSRLIEQEARTWAIPL